MFTQRGEVCNRVIFEENQVPRGQTKNLLVTVQGSNSKLWGSRPLVVKVTVEYDISISVGISSNAVSTSCQSHWWAVTS